PFDPESHARLAGEDEAAAVAGPAARARDPDVGPRRIVAAGAPADDVDGVPLRGWNADHHVPAPADVQSELREPGQVAAVVPGRLDLIALRRGERDAGRGERRSRAGRGVVARRRRAVRVAR